MNTDPTLEYYNENAVSFTENTPDVRPGRETERWLNVFLRKRQN